MTPIKMFLYNNTTTKSNAKIKPTNCLVFNNIFSYCNFKGLLIIEQIPEKGDTQNSLQINLNLYHINQLNAT